MTIELHQIAIELETSNITPKQAQVKLLCLLGVTHRYITDRDLETIEEHRDLMEDVINGDYNPDSFTNQPIDKLIYRIKNGGR
jgi:hypothetical protein